MIEPFYERGNDSNKDSQQYSSVRTDKKGLEPPFVAPVMATTKDHGLLHFDCH